MALLESIEELQAQKAQAVADAQRVANDTLSASGEVARSVLTPTEETYEKADKSADARALVLGLSPEAATSEKRGNNLAIGDMRAKLVGQLASQKLSIQRDTLNKNLQSLNERIAQKEAQRQAISQAAGGLVQAGLTTLGTVYGGPAGGALGSAVGGAVKGGLTKAVNGSQGFTPDPKYINGVPKLFE